MKWQVQFCPDGASCWGPDELYGEYDDDAGRPLFDSQEEAEARAQELNDQMGEGWPAGEYIWDEYHP